MTDYEYECEVGHWVSSPAAMTECPAFVLGEPCAKPLTDLAIRQIRPSRPPQKLYLCQPCLDAHRQHHPDVLAAEVKRLGLASKRHTCDECQGERAVASVPNLSLAS